MQQPAWQLYLHMLARILRCKTCFLHVWLCLPYICRQIHYNMWFRCCCPKLENQEKDINSHPVACLSKAFKVLSKLCICTESPPAAAGDGHTCQETPAVEDLVNQYSITAMEGPLLCDVLYPTNAPGYVDDPTGSVARSAAKQVTIICPLL